MKDIMAYKKGKETEAGSVKDTDDQGTVGTDDPKDYTVLSFGGNIEGLIKVLSAIEPRQNRGGGNPDAIGGQEKQSSTLGQDQMLLQSASVRIEYWRGKLRDGIQSALQSVAGYVWDNEGDVVRVSHRSHGSPTAVVHQWNRDEFPGAFEDYEIDVSPYGFTGDSPERKYQRITTWVEKILTPWAMQAVQQGYQIDVARIIRTTGELAEVPGIEKLVRRVVAQAQQQAPNIQIGGDTINAGRAQRALPAQELPNTEAAQEQQQPAMAGAAA